MSENVERRIVEVLDNPTTSPYGNPIPGLEHLGVDLTATEDKAVRLVDLPQGDSTVVVARMSEHAQADPELISELRQAGVVPNARISVNVAPRAVIISTPGHDGLTLSSEISHAIFVYQS